MASDLAFVEFVLDQLDDDLSASYKRMFGEFGLYANGKFFGVICDSRLFVKPTQAGRAFIGDVVEAPAYPGARPSLLIEDRIDDPRWLSDLVRITIRELPEAASRRRRTKA